MTRSGSGVISGSVSHGYSTFDPMFCCHKSYWFERWNKEETQNSYRKEIE